MDTLVSRWRRWENLDPGKSMFRYLEVNKQKMYYSIGQLLEELRNITLDVLVIMTTGTTFVTLN